MAKPLAGKKAFYAMGQRDRAIGQNATPAHIRRLAGWARQSYINGWFGW